MPMVADWKPGELYQILVYGTSKVGKTFGAYTFPRPIVMDFDKGIAVARNPDFVTKYGAVNFEYIQFTELNVKRGVPTAHNAFDDACKFFDAKMATGERDKFDTWVVDSGTTLSAHAQYKAIILMGQMKLSKTHEMALQQGLIIPKIQDYGSERSLVEQFVDMVLSSGKNVVLICHEKEVTDDDGNVLRIEPLLTGKSSEAVPLKFNEVYRLRARKVGPEYKRLLMTQTDGISKVGSRMGVPDGTEWNYPALKAEMDKIKAAMLAGVKVGIPQAAVASA